MGRRPRRGRSDANQSKVIRDLRQTGCSVLVISSLSEGCGDAVVGLGGVNYLVEIKDPDQPPSKRRLNENEKQFHESWRGQVAVIHSAEEFMQKIQVTR